MTKLGFIGLGNMGAPMAVNLARGGCDVTVYDLKPEAAAAPLAAGAKLATSAQQLARQADILFTSLPEPRHVAAALPTLLAEMKRGALWVDLTTNSTELLSDLERTAATNGIAVVESPVTGAVDGARRGKLTLFVGGEDTAVARAEPYLALLGTVIRCGALGNGNIVKLITNQVWFINAIAMGEALALGKAAGVDLATLWDALKNSVGDTFVMRHDAPSVFAGHYDPSFSLGLCCKDLRLLQEIRSRVGAAAGLTDLTQEQFEQTRQKYGDDAAELLVCKQIEEQLGVELRLEGNWAKHWEA